MAYRPVVLSTNTPPRVRQLINEYIENLSFSDIHTMLQLPLPDYELGAGCGFAITHVLMSVIGGVSTTLYDPTRNGGKDEIGKKFTRLLEDYYPWNREPSSGLPPRGAANIIYEVFRNPLTHDLGLNVKGRRLQVSIKRLRISVNGEERTGLREREIEQLERGPRPKMSATVTRSDQGIILFVEALYWGVRRMIEKISVDKTRMKAAEKFLSEL